MKIYVVISGEPYDGYNKPCFISSNKQEAKIYFDKLVEKLKTNEYGRTFIDLYEYERDEGTLIEPFNLQDYLYGKRIEKWKKENPGKELPNYSPVVLCTTENK